MEFGVLTATGDRAGDLAAEVIAVEKTRTAGKFNPDPTDFYRYEGEGFTMLAYESMDVVRTQSWLMVAVVFEEVDAETTRVVIMAGGGGEGIRKRDYTIETKLAGELLGTEAGAEAVAFERAVEDIERAGGNLDLEVEPA